MCSNNSDNQDEPDTDVTRTRPISDRVYEPDDLLAFDLLQHPVWVFDIEKKKMFWANPPALELWFADTLPELLARDFTKMSPTIAKRMADQLVRLKRGEIMSEQWTAYPKGKPKTIALTGSAIRIDGGRVAALCETELPNNTDFKNAAVRGLEILRYLPMAVSQFDIEGKLAYQNPEAMGLFGGAEKEEEAKKETKPEEDSDEAKLNHFLARFVDKKLGQYALDQVVQGRDYSVEAEQHMAKGDPKTFSVSIRHSLDPVTSKPIVLYSARDITEILKARRETTQANVRTDFLADISHEIRTPLHQIIGGMDLLGLTELSPQQLETVEMVQASSVALMAIVNDMLTYTKLENGKLTPDKTEFAPDALVNACVATIEQEAKEKGLKLVITKTDLPDKLIGDPYRLRQILLNLIGNAVKFTHHGSVTFLFSMSEGVDGKARLKAEIRDTGIGIHPHHHTRIFEKYEQANVTITRNYGGAGLGLSICKRLTEAMGGEIGVQSELGKGTTFFLNLPFEVPPQPKRTKPSREPLSETKASSGGLRILVVEDNVVNQKMLCKMLQRMGHVVKVAEHGQIAVDEIKADASYNLVLMDVQMPIMDGIEATQHIRGKLGFDKERLPIVGVTASFEHSSMGYYHEVGMNTCIGKPARMNIIKRVIAETARQPT